MSLVVAYKRDDVVYMGADTQATCGTAIDRLMNENGYKITRLANGMLIGVCGRVKAHQKVMAQKKWFDIPENETFDKRYIVKHIIPRLSELMKGMSEDKGARCSSMEAKFLIVWRDRLFVILRSFGVYECRSIAIGAGDDYARYTLSQIRSADEINERLLQALRAGAHFESTISAPYILIDTKHKEYKIVED